MRPQPAPYSTHVIHVEETPMDTDKANHPAATSGRHTNFPAAAPESNVNPPGAPQSSHGSATEPVPGGTGMQSGTPGARQGVVTPEHSAATADRGTGRREG
jgi:hypothetical protein